MDTITITINPSLDKSTTVEKLAAEVKLRCSTPRYEAGGGGINVSRVLKRLNIEALTLCSTGGQSGDALIQLLQEEKIRYHAFKTSSWTRENTVVTDQSNGKQYRFTYQGAVAHQEEWMQFLDFLHQAGQKPKIIVASGSLPAGVPEHFYAQMAEIAQKIGAKLILDTAGKGLELALKTNSIYLIKPNLEELQSLTNRSLSTREEIGDAALELVRSGSVQVVAVSLGAEGAMLVSKEAVFSIHPPKVEVKSIVGAGDSMVAGMVAYLNQGKSLKEILKFGVACGTATAMSEGTELCSRKDVLAVFNSIDTQ